jgi:hypothetical protein
MVHVSQRLAERGISIPQWEIDGIARGCRHDTAVILCQVECRMVADGYIGSNGDLVILIVRHKYPVTIMYRRSNQPLTTQALQVDEIIDRSKLQ